MEQQTPATNAAAGAGGQNGNNNSHGRGNGRNRNRNRNRGPRGGPGAGPNNNSSANAAGDVAPPTSTGNGDHVVTNDGAAAAAGFQPHRNQRTRGRRGGGGQDGGDRNAVESFAGGADANRPYRDHNHRGRGGRGRGGMGRGGYRGDFGAGQGSHNQSDGDNAAAAAGASEFGHRGGRGRGGRGRGGYRHDSHQARHGTANASEEGGSGNVNRNYRGGHRGGRGGHHHHHHHHANPNTASASEAGGSVDRSNRGDVAGTEAQQPLRRRNAPGTSAGNAPGNSQNGDDAEMERFKKELEELGLTMADLESDSDEEEHVIHIDPESLIVRKESCPAENAGRATLLMNVAVQHLLTHDSHNRSTQARLAHSSISFTSFERAPAQAIVYNEKPPTEVDIEIEGRAYDETVERTNKERAKGGAGAGAGADRSLTVSSGVSGAGHTGDEPKNNRQAKMIAKLEAIDKSKLDELTKFCVLCQDRKSCTQKDNSFFVYFNCRHDFCMMCGIKYVFCRAIDADKLECPLCKAEVKFVVISSRIDLHLLMDSVTLFDLNYTGSVKIRTDNMALKETLTKLLSLQCPRCDTITGRRSTEASQDTQDINEHVIKCAKQVVCYLCQADKTMLPSEMKMYNFRSLLQHIVNGSIVDEQYVRHFFCRLCKKAPALPNFEALARHYCENHYYCHMCSNFPPTVFFRDYMNLNQHLNAMHFSCRVCYENRIPEYFNDENGLREHVENNHPSLPYERQMFMFPNFLNALLADPTQFVLGPNRGNRDLEFDVTLMIRNALENVPGAVRYRQDTDESPGLDQQLRQAHAELMNQHPERLTTSTEVFNIHFPALPNSDPSTVVLPRVRPLVSISAGPGSFDEFPLLPQAAAPAIAMRARPTPAIRSLGLRTFPNTTTIRPAAAPAAAAAGRSSARPGPRFADFDDDDESSMVAFKINSNRHGGVVFSSDSGQAVQEEAPRQVKLIEAKQSGTQQMTAYKKPNLDKDFPALGEPGPSTSAPASGPSSASGSPRHQAGPPLTMSALAAPAGGNWSHRPMLSRASAQSTTTTTGVKKSLKVPLSGNRPNAQSSSAGSSRTPSSQPGPSNATGSSQATAQSGASTSAARPSSSSSSSQPGPSKGINSGASTSSLYAANVDPKQPPVVKFDKNNEFLIPEGYANKIQIFFVDFHLVYKQMEKKLLTATDISFFLKQKSALSPEASTEALREHYNQMILRFGHKTIDIIWPNFLSLLVTNVAMQHRWLDFYREHMADPKHEPKVGMMHFLIRGTNIDFTAEGLVKSAQVCERCAQVVVEHDMEKHVLQHGWTVEDISKHKRSLEGVILKPVEIAQQTKQALYAIWAQFDEVLPPHVPQMIMLRSLVSYHHMPE